MTAGRHTIVGLGEIVWDLLPAGPQLGGAPANFAHFAALLGNHAVPASRIGTDARGKDTLHRLQQSGLTTQYVQEDASHPTGTVLVNVDENGQPGYTIAADAAWDFLEFTPQWQKLAAIADAVCFGTLAQRSAVSRETIRRFLKATRQNALRIFDVNLRQGFYSAEILDESLGQSKVVKLNHQELPVVLQLLGLEGGDDERGARTLLQAYQLELVCVTRGAHGGLLVNDAAAVSHPGYPITTADAVGAGDAFTAALIHHYLRGASLATISRAANLLGASVASQAGATPPIEPAVLKQVIEGAETS